jgi:hypothetical protein
MKPRVAGVNPDEDHKAILSEIGVLEHCLEHCSSIRSRRVRLHRNLRFCQPDRRRCTCLSLKRGAQPDQPRAEVKVRNTCESLPELAFTSAAMWCGCGAPASLQATGRSRGTPARRAIETDGISRQTIRGVQALAGSMEVVGRRRSPRLRPVVQSSKSSSSPRGALVVARWRNCGAL